MTSIDAATQFHIDMQEALNAGAMDTTPISQQSLQPDVPPSFLNELPSPISETSLQSQLLQDTSSGFLPKAEHPNGMLAAMHLSMPDLSATPFMSAMEAVEGSTHSLLHTAPPGFMADMTQADPFLMATPRDIAMGLEMSPDSVAHSTSPPQSQVPSPSIHGMASSYGLGVTSSLESALDPNGVSGGRSRANTSVSPTSLPSSFLSTSQPAQQQPAFPPQNSAAGKQEAQVSKDPVLNHLIADVLSTATDVRDVYDRYATPDSLAVHVEELIGRASQLQNLIASMSLAPKFTQSFPPPQAPQPSVPEQTINFASAVPAKSTTIDLTGQLNVPDHSRKRCASDLEGQRTLKAPKREPQEDQPLSFPAIETSLPMPGETSPPFPAPGITLPQSGPLTIPSSQPPSRPVTPPPAFTPRAPYSPVVQQSPLAPSFPTFSAPVSAPIELTSTIPPAVSPTSPTFPIMHPSWSDTVIITSRHHHSSSAGSMSSLQGMQLISPPVGAANGMDPFTPAALPAPQPLSVASTTSSISQPIGRMSRSGSINGTPFPTGGYTFGYMPSESASGWPNITRQPNMASASRVGDNWYFGNDDTSPSTSDTPGTASSTARNSPSDDEDDDGSDSDENDTGQPKASTRLPSADHPSTSASSDVPQEYRAEVDRIFFEFLNRICSNLEATDSKGEPIHQTLMAKKMQRLDESPDFRPFKFRIQAFTLAFLEELARQGYPEEKIPMKKIRNYLWRQQYILRFNEDGKKAKSKGNHIWNIEAKKAGDGKWEFRPFHRKLAGSPPGMAYCGLKWSWTPRIWDPQASWQNVPVTYSSPNLPSWLSWKDDVLSGIPPPDAESSQIIVNAKFVLDGQEGQLSQTINVGVAPLTTIDTATFSRSRRPSLAGEPPRRSTSDSALFQFPTRAKLLTNPNTTLEPDTRVIRVLESVAQRVTEETETAYQFAVSASPSKPDELQELAKQKHVLEQTVDAFHKETSGMGHGQTRLLAVAAQNVVVQAAHTVVADRTIATGVTPAHQSNASLAAAVQSVTVNELTDATQDAIAMAVKSHGTSSTEVDIIVAATSILKARTPALDTSPPAVIQQPRSHLGAISTINMVTGYPSTNLSTLPEYA